MLGVAGMWGVSRRSYTLEIQQICSVWSSFSRLQATIFSSLQKTWTNRFIMSNDWSNGLCSCFEDFSTCKLQPKFFLNFVCVFRSSYNVLFFNIQVSSHGLCHATLSERALNNSARTAWCTDSPTSSPFLTGGADLRSVERSGSRKESKAHVSRISCASCSVTSVLWSKRLG